MTTLANPERVTHEALAAILAPPAPIDYLAFAVRHIVIDGGSFPGPYNPALFPYFDEILRALSPEDPCRIVTLAASAQIGKTTAANIFTLGSLVMARGNVLYVHPTEDNAHRWSKMKLAPMMRSTAIVRENFPQRSRDLADSVTYKERKDGLAALLISGANSPASLSQVTAWAQCQDDLSKWDINNAGDPEVQADSRSRAIETAKIFKLSTPLVQPGCRISRDFDAGSRERPFVPCPHCGHMHVLEWENMLAALDPEKPEDTHFTCPSCGGVIEERHRPEMLARFEWRAENPAAKRDHRSFWIWSAYSYLQSWKQIAGEWLRARGEPGAERVFLNDTAGLPYRAHGTARKWEDLRDRAAAAAYARGEVPPGALLLFLGMDCQKDRVEWQLVGFGSDFRRYVVDYGIVAGHISEPDCQRNLDILLARKWPKRGAAPLGIDRAAIDGNAFTEDVWSFARRHPISTLIMVRGRGDDNAPTLKLVKREHDEKTGKVLARSRRFYNLGVSVLKDRLYRDLEKDDPLEHGYIAFPRGLDDEFFQELTAERREARKQGGFTVYRWVKDDLQDNEALDTFVQATGAAINHGVYGRSDVYWHALAKERESLTVQRDLEELIGEPLPERKRMPSLASRLAR